jgi:hypothetical protein
MRPGIGSRVGWTKAEDDSDINNGGRNRRESGSGRSSKWKRWRPGLGSHLAVATTGSVDYGIAVMITPFVECYEEEDEEENEDVLKGSDWVCMGYRPRRRLADHDTPKFRQTVISLFQVIKNHVRYVTGSSSRLILLSFLAHFELIRCPLHGP